VSAVKSLLWAVRTLRTAATAATALPRRQGPTFAEIICFSFCYETRAKKGKKKGVF
jgi:hypothetical protein